MHKLFEMSRSAASLQGCHRSEERDRETLLAEIDELLFAQQQRIDIATCHPNAVKITLPAVMPQQPSPDSSQQKKPPTKLELIVRLDYLGLLCGPGGTRLRDIQSGSGCTRIEVMRYKAFYCEGLEWSVIQIEGEEASSEGGLELLSQAYERGINTLWSKKGPGQDANIGLRRADVEEITRVELFVPVHVIGTLLGAKGRGLGSQLQSSHRVAIHCKTDVSGCIFAVVASRGQRWVTLVIDGVEAQALEARSILEAEMTKLLGENREQRLAQMQTRRMKNKGLGALFFQCAAPPPGLNVSAAIPEVAGWTAAIFPVAESFPCLPQTKMRETLFGDEVLPFISNKLGGELKVRLHLRGLGSGEGLGAPGATDPMHVHVSAHTPGLLASALERLQKFLAGAATTRSHEFIENEMKAWKTQDKNQGIWASRNQKREEQQLVQRSGIAVVEVTPPERPVHHQEHGGWQEYGGWQHQNGNGSSERGAVLLEYGAAIAGSKRFVEDEPSKLPFRIGYLGGDRVTMDIGIPSSQHMWPVVQEMISDLQEQAQGFNLSLNPLSLSEIYSLGWGGSTNHPGANHGVRIWGGDEDCKAFLSCVEGTVHELLGGGSNPSPVNEIPYAPPLLSHKRKAEEWGGYTMVDTCPLHHTKTAKI